MSDTTDSVKYRWTPESTKLLVSVWTDKQVQKQLEYSQKPQLIWDSVAKYMSKKGYNVSGRQCRSRMKQVLVCYQEKKREGTFESVEPYYDLIEKVLRVKRTGNPNLPGGVDTVDYVKSPPKDVKTSKNMQVRYRNQKPVESIYRTHALSPMWGAEQEDSYPESPESTETVLAQPYRVFSPVKDAATNTTAQCVSHLNKKPSQENVGTTEEAPVKENCRPTSFTGSNYFGEIPYQNAVQNVQNHIIQENMQQYQALLQQNLLQNQLLNQNRLNLNANMPTMNHLGLYDNNNMQNHIGLAPNVIENILRVQNQYQQNVNLQEPRKNFRQNLMQTHPQFHNNGNLNKTEYFTPSVSPDIPTNLNEAFCNQAVNPQTADVTMLTNNATFNDDSISIDFLQNSPDPDGEQMKQKDMNNDEIPKAPLRQKKAQKLEQLMLSAINSQSDVVNKILTAQNDMVSRVLDLDRDRQSRLENRLDHLLDVVQAAVLNRSSDKGSDIHRTTPEPVITNLAPPPKPGTIPPKLDLVPPKPCRIACVNNSNNNNNQVVGQDPPTTRPGVVSPMSPSKRIGAIWSKLGPVSTSPFVKAQQQLGFRPIHNIDVRTQSSAERRIAQEFRKGSDPKTLKIETLNFLNAERKIQEITENARIEVAFDKDMSARRKLFQQKEPSAASVLTSAFLEAERQSTELTENRFNKNSDNLLSGHGDSFERLRRLRLEEQDVTNPFDSSTPAKVPPPPPPPMCNIKNSNTTRQAVQHFTQMIQNAALKNRTNEEVRHRRPKDFQNMDQVDGNSKTLGWLQDRYSYSGLTMSRNDLAQDANKRWSQNNNGSSMGWIRNDQNSGKHIGFVRDNEVNQNNNNPTTDTRDPFKQLYELYCQKQNQLRNLEDNREPYMTSNGQIIMAQGAIIDRYMKENFPKRDNDSDNEEYLDTTSTLHPPGLRKNSQSSTGTKAGGVLHSCSIS